MDNVAELAAKQAITEVIHRYCRGLDRMDRALVASCWHPGGTDDHAPLYAGPFEGFIDWVFPLHAGMECTRHNVSNILIELDGDKAASETYWTLTLRTAINGTLCDIQAQGRYVDNWECIDDVWAIRHRQSLSDLDRVEPVQRTLADPPEDPDAPPAIMPNNPDVPPKPSTRDPGDYSYRYLKR